MRTIIGVIFGVSYRKWQPCLCDSTTMKFTYFVLIRCYNVGLYYINGLTALLDTGLRGIEFHCFLVVGWKLFPIVLYLSVVSTDCHVSLIGCHLLNGNLSLCERLVSQFIGFIALW